MILHKNITNLQFGDYMKAKFLPKSLSGIGSRKFVIDFQSGQTFTQMHWHDCIEIIYVEQGSIRVFFSDKWQDMFAGEMLLIPPHRIHYIHCYDDNTKKAVLGISNELICDTNISEQSVILPFKTEKINDFCHFKGDGKFAEIFNILRSTENNYHGSLIIQSELLKLYAYIYNEWQKIGLDFIEPITDKNIYKLINFLEENYVEAPTAEQMSKFLNMSYSNMSRIINEKLGTSYNSLLNSIRVENAKKLLLSTNKNITEICFDCGFQNSSYFIKTFKNKVGITPNKYRSLQKIN